MSRSKILVAKWVGAFLLLFCSFSYSNAEIVTLPIPGAPGLNITVGTGVNALPLQDIRNNPNAVNITTWDDHITEVPLGFNFPFFGQTFTNSWAATNGYVTFQDPWQSGLGGGCCSGVDLRNTTNPAYNYTIFGLHTDLYSWNGQNQYYLRGNNEMTYGWYNISQCCSSNGGNSFEIKINSSGAVDTRIAGAMVSWNSVTSGMSGNLANGEYFQYYHGQGLNITPGSANIFSWNTAGGFTGVDQCTINPLSSPTCPGYAAAYTTQQCSINALYNPSCPGYAAAYFTQQCSLNSLYDVNCPGYATAYLNYQCSINPLYSTTCEGYENAYFNQQCSANALYSTSCTGYAEAYFAQQCSIDGLYSTSCPNYATAYATQQALRQSQQNTTVSTPVSTPAQTTVTSAPTNDGSSSVPIAVVADPIVNQAVTSTATSTSPASAATATVPLVQTVTTEATTTTAAATNNNSSNESKKEEKNASTSDTNSSQSTSTASASTTSNSKTEAKPTARQELQARREAAAKAQAVERGKNLANEVGKAADMESQKQVQNVIIAAMGFTPGFDAYNQVAMKDVIGYKPYTVYNNQTNVDNRKLSRGLMGPSDSLHQQMVDSQWRK